MKNLTLKRIQAMASYQPPLDGRADYKGVLLDFNERTTSTGYQRYPEYGNLAEQIGDYVGVSADEVLVTNGSDQAIDLIFRAFVDVGDHVVLPEPSFAMFKQCAQVQGATLVTKLNRSTKLCVVCNPNNPTGSLTPLIEVEQMVQAYPNTIFLIDEAYAEFSGVTAIPLIERYSNIVVTRTFSKAFGLAAARIGYVVANATYIQELQKIRGPYDMNTQGVQLASEALNKVSEMQAYVNEVMQQAKPLLELFFKKNGIEFYPSQANFILFKPSNAIQTAELLEQNGFRVRPQNKPGIDGTLRVSIGTVQQMRQFINIYQQAILKRQTKKIAFLDRDGTLVYEPEITKQLDDLKDVRILDGVISALQRLQQDDYLLVMVTNQDGLGTASFPQDKFDVCQAEIIQQFKRANIAFEEVLICPHVPADNCLCRKPKTGLVDELLCDYAIDAQESFMCGDRPSDEQFANNLGIPFYATLNRKTCNH